MKEKIEQILNEVKNFQAENKEALENFRITYLSKKGVIPALFADFKNVAPELRKEMGMRLNELKNTVTEKVEEQLQKFETQNASEAGFDLTMPANDMRGARHPLSIVRRDINEIFEHLGFTIAEGPEIEDDYHVFTALNFALDHPARDMQDTFFIQKDPNENKPTDIL
ncbi:MAG: phenylalanine--tRNA ligase subunit alpha, partial [Bacteroidales bacterium]|nr:phenylalanine--tRNA ligase subunit alpha [Bacteroidales bacterium]